MTEPVKTSGRLLDYLVAGWIVLAGGAFVISPTELVPVGRYVYVLALTVCIVSAGLGIARRRSGHG